MFERGCYVPVGESDLDPADLDALPDGISPDEVLDTLGPEDAGEVRRTVDRLEAEHHKEVALELELNNASVAAIVAAEQLQVFGEIADLRDDAVLARAASAQRALNLAGAEQLVLATQWADLHSELAFPDRTGKGRERLIFPGGEGTPGFGEFCLAE